MGNDRTANDVLLDTVLPGAAPAHREEPATRKVKTVGDGARDASLPTTQAERTPHRFSASARVIELPEQVIGSAHDFQIPLPLNLDASGRGVVMRMKVEGEGMRLGADTLQQPSLFGSMAHGPSIPSVPLVFHPSHPGRFPATVQVNGTWEDGHVEEGTVAIVASARLPEEAPTRGGDRSAIAVAAAPALATKMEPHPLHDPDEYDAAKHPKVDQRTIPLQGHDRTHVLDTTVAAAAMLRRIYEKSYVDAELKGEPRKAKVIVAADDASTLVKELEQVNALGKPSWSQVGNELAHAVREMTRLQSEAPGPEKARVTQALASLEHLVGPKVFAGAKQAIDKADRLPALTVEQRIELAAQAVIAACRDLAIFHNQRPKEGKAPKNEAERKLQQKLSSDEAAAILDKVRLHYSVASDALTDLATSDEAKRRLIMMITSDVKLATDGMDHVQQFITIDHNLPWRAEFAAGFDAEVRFLQLMGLEKQYLPTGRVYSGSIDPEAAMKEISDLAKHKKEDNDWMADKFQTSQQAVDGIGVMVEELFNQQRGGLTRFASDIKEPPPPKDKSTLDFLLEVLIKTALAAGAGAIGSFIQTRAKSSMDSLVKKEVESSSSWVTKTIGKEGDDAAAFMAARASIQKQAIETGVGRNVLKAEALKDSVKELFKTVGFRTITGALGSVTSSVKSNSGEIRSAFSQTSASVLDQASVQARMEFIHLAPALNQASPDGLWALYQTLLSSMQQANEIQYDIAHEEWQNFKARSHNGVAVDTSAKDQHAYHAADVQSPKDRKEGKVAKDDAYESRDANIGGDHAGSSKPEFGPAHEEEDGALVIEAYINTDDFLGATGDPQLSVMRLVGAEHAAYTHFKNENKPLNDMHVNKHFRLKFLAYMNDTTINIGIGPDHGLLESTLGESELTALRVIAEKEKVSSSNLIAARSDDKYTRHKRADLERVLMKYITVLQKLVKTGSLSE